MEKYSLFKLISYITVVFLAIALLYAGNRIASGGMARNEDDNGTIVVEAKVINISHIQEHTTAFDSWEAITFEAQILRGDHRGEIVTFTQNVRGYFLERFPRPAEVGDRVMLAMSAHGSWSFLDYVRIYNILILGSVFIVLLIIFGRVKGFNSILALGLTFTAIFAVFIPSILSGRNIYLWSITVCVYSIITTLFIINGVNKKSAAAIIGCLGGVAAAGLLTFFMGILMELTGITQTESIHLLYLAEYPIDLNAIIFAGIIIGAVGAIMDMSVSISSALWELKNKAPNSAFREIFRSGINIGKDIMGSNINTLVLAYIGSSLTIILILLARVNSLFRLLNRELVLVEFLQAIVGSFGIFLTMPLTALVCAVLYKCERHY